MSKNAPSLVASPLAGPNSAAWPDRGRARCQASAESESVAGRLASAVATGRDHHASRPIADPIGKLLVDELRAQVPPAMKQDSAAKVSNGKAELRGAGENDEGPIAWTPAQSYRTMPVR